MILEVAASGCLPCLPFGTIGPHGLHDYECTLELQVQPHWLALYLLVGDGPGAENHSQLRSVMWLFALPYREYHVFICPILTGWLTLLLEFCDGFSG